MNKVVIAIIVWLCCIINSTSQTLNSVSGTIKNADSQELLQGVSLKISNLTLETLTTSEGAFIFQNIPIGEYELIVFLKGFQSQNITIQLSENTQIELGTIFLKPNYLDFTDNSIISLSDEDLLEDDARNSANISGVFQSSKDTYLKAAAYNFSQVWFKIRGYDSSYGTVLINGVEMNKLYDGRPQWSNWGGLNDALRNQEFTTGIAPATYTFGNILGTTNFSVKASDHQKGGKVSIAAANKSYKGRIMATYASGFNSKNWAFAASGSVRLADEGYLNGTSYKSWSGFLAIEKRLNIHNSINLTAFTSFNRRGKSSPNTQEVFDLKGYKYNAYWGNQEGEMRNSRVKEIFEPVIMLSHFFDKNKTSINTTIAYQFGHIGNSRLGYFNAPNPDATYWKYLPSNFLRFEDQLDYANAYLAEQEMISNGQVNWNNLYEVNSEQDHALYYLYEDRVEDKQLFLNSNINSNLTETLNLNAGISFRKLSSDNFGNMLDLLGGNNFIDLDQYALGDARQNDLNNPNREIQVNDKFQYNYNIKASVLGAFAQIQSFRKKIDYFVGINFKSTTYLRNGFYKNGSYPNNSFGKSELQSFVDLSAKGGISYKITGRHLLNLNAAYISNAPTIKNTFSNSRVNNSVTPNLSSEQINTTDLTYLYRSSKFQGRLTGYYTKFKNAVESSFFFAEGLYGDQADFVSEIMTEVDKKNIGLELSGRYQATSSVAFLIAGSVGQFTYNNNPNLYIQSESFSDLESDFGTAYLKNYFVSGTPQRAYSLGFEYQDPSYWWFQINANSLTHNYLDISPILRTDNFYLDADGIPFVDDETGTQVSQEQINSLLIQEQFDDVFLLNAVGGKSWFLENNYFGFFLGINNILGEIFKSGGFEQARNANYKELKQDQQLAKPLFGPKYWYGSGTSFYLNLYVRF